MKSTILFYFSQGDAELDQTRPYIHCKSEGEEDTGADPGFQVRGGGALKKVALNGGRREHFWGISCEKSRFYAKKSYFFQLRREARKFLGYFVWKITILRQKIIFFPTLGVRPPWIRPCNLISTNCLFVYCLLHLCIRMFIVFLCNINHCNDSVPCWDLDWTIKSYLMLANAELCYASI